MKGTSLNIKDNVVFLGHMHKYCSPLQEIRELTVNSIQSILRMRTTQADTGQPLQPGKIIWDVDWLMYDDGLPKKLCIVDNGDGIQPNDMEEFLNQLSAGIQTRSLDGDTNYGIGGKVAALPLNKCGLTYQSWIPNEPLGHCIRLGIFTEPAESYGMVEITPGESSKKIPMVFAPQLIKEYGHGTKVTLSGNAEREDTVMPPSRAVGGTKWLSHYLNSKIFILPDDITIYTREWQTSSPPRGNGDWDEHFPFRDQTVISDSFNFLRQIQGIHTFLEAHKTASGSVRLVSGSLDDGFILPATAYWWILKDSEPLKNTSGYIHSTGHVALLFDNNGITEVYEPLYRANSLLQFGVLDTSRRVFIFIKPDSVPGLAATSGRDRLKVGRYDMPWDCWQQEFAEKLPPEIGDLYQPEIRNTDSIKEKIKHLHKLLDIPSYRKTVRDAERETLERGKVAAENVDEPEKPKVGAKGSGPGGSGQRRLFPVNDTMPEVDGWLRKLEIMQEETEIEDEKPDIIPNIIWVSKTPNKKFQIEMARQDEDGAYELNDRAAQYFDSTNMLRINYDFRGFQHFLKWMIGTQKRKEKIDLITKDVMESVELGLVEVILGITNITHGTGTWVRQDFLYSLTPEALTAASMQRYHAEQVLWRNIGLKIGSKRRGQPRGKRGRPRKT